MTTIKHSFPNLLPQEVPLLPRVSPAKAVLLKEDTDEKKFPDLRKHKASSCLDDGADPEHPSLLLQKVPMLASPSLR